MAGVLLPPSHPPFPGAKPAAAHRMQMAKTQFVGKCPLINNLRVFSLSGSDILHFSSPPHQPKTFNDVVLLTGCAAHAKYLQAFTKWWAGSPAPLSPPPPWAQRSAQPPPVPGAAADPSAALAGGFH